MTNLSSRRLTLLRRTLFAVVGAPLVCLHVLLLTERLREWHTIDATVVARWTLSFVLLAVLRAAATRISPTQTQKLLCSAVVFFALIHAPVAGPEPGLSLVVTGIGLALVLAVVRPTVSSLDVDDISARIFRAVVAPPARVSANHVHVRGPPVLV